jgi:ABC-type uncharacterized transport system permease subunit
MSEAIAVHEELSRRRGLTSLSRLQLLGIVFVVLGLLVVWLSRALSGEDVAFVFGLGDLAPRVPLDPPNTVLAMGVVMALLGGVAVAEPRTKRWALVALLVGAALAVPVILVSGLAASDTKQTNLLPLIVESLRLGTPIALGAAAGLWCERSGVVNIGIEGMMLGGAGIGFVIHAVLNGAQGGGALWAGVLAAIATGALLGGLHAGLSVTFRTDQIVSGVAINLLALGLTSFLRSEVLQPRGVASGTTLPVIQIPLLSSIPVVGEPLFSGKPIYLLMFVIFIATAVVLGRTAWGLRVKAVGENPAAAETLGIGVARVRYQAVILGGALAGLGGAWYSLETAGSFNDAMTGGTGFIALAALIFGKWKPWGAFGGAMLFGFAQALGSRIALLDLEIGGYPVPSQFLQALPYVVTIIVLAGAIGSATPPAAVGVPYQRSR